MVRTPESSRRFFWGGAMRRVKQGAVVFVIVFAAAQLIRPERANPATDVSRTIQAQAGTSTALAAVLDRSCRDCHSNNTVWPWYTRIAPLSWLMARGVAEGLERSRIMPRPVHRLNIPRRSAATAWVSAR